MYDEDVGSTIYEIEGPSREEIRQKLWRQYGTSYQIVGSKTILKGGFLGFGQKEVIQISYRLCNPDDKDSSKQNGRQNLSDSAKASSGKLSKEEAESFIEAQRNLLKKVDPQTVEKAALKTMLEDMKSEIIQNVTEMKNASSNEEHPTIKEIQRKLKLNEFSDSYISMITEKIRKQFSVEELEDFDKVQMQVVDWIGESIQIAKPKSYRSPHVIIVIGPTGVGKTTTIAKMAGNLILQAREKDVPVPAIRLITIDTMRVGAEAQLKNYGEIMELTVDKAESVDDVKKIFNDYKSRLDYLLIDTSGYSPNDFENIGKMRAFLEVPSLKPDVYLAFTAGSKANDIRRILTNYEQFNYSSVIVTKFDETDTFGNVISVLQEKNKSISWITDGQQVPRFIEKASPIKFLINLQEFTVDRKHIEEKFNKDDEE